MMSTPFTLTVMRERERERLASPWQVAGFGLSMALVLMLAFPEGSLEHLLESSSYGDATTQAYFSAWLRAKPDDAHLRLILVGKLMQQGELAAASVQLGWLLGNPGAEVSTRELELLALEVDRREMLQAASSDADYARLRTQYLDRLQRVAQDDRNQAQLAQFAEAALAVGDTVLGRGLYLRLLLSDHHPGEEQCRRVANLFLADRQYRQAADVYFAMLPHATQLPQRRRLFFAGLDVLRSGNMPKDLMRAAEAHVGSLAGDSQTLLQLARLAELSSRPDLAEKYVNLLLRQSAAARAHTT